MCLFFRRLFGLFFVLSCITSLKTYTLIGGFSGLTWAQLNTHLSQSVECRTFALDLRGHGETILQNVEDESDLSAARLADDVLRVVDKLLGNY